MFEKAVLLRDRDLLKSAVERENVVHKVVEASQSGALTDELAGALSFLAWLEQQNYLFAKQLPGRPGYWAAIQPLMFHYSIQGGHMFDKWNVALRWCYTDDFAAVKKAFDAWDGTGEPEGWHRHPGTGRRRTDGDPEQEYLAG